MTNSIIRAEKLFSHSINAVNYYIIKIKPTISSCCCFHCWPKTYKKINYLIRDQGFLRDEGDCLIRGENYEYVLECHESGPEIIISLDQIINYSGFIVSLISLIVTIIQAHKEEKPNQNIEIKILNYSSNNLNSEKIIICDDVNKINITKILDEIK